MEAFKSLAQCSDRIARGYLTRNEWNLNQALNDYYDTERHDESEKAVQSCPPELHDLFVQYSSATNAEPLIDSEGLINFISDLGYEVEDMATICLAKFLDCHRLTDGITEAQFCRAWQLERCTTIIKMREVLQKLDHKLHTDIDYLEKIYNYTFDLVLDPGAKTLSTDMALQYWTPFFSSGSYPIIVESRLYQFWLDFIQQEQSISKDSWKMLLQFFKRFPDLFTVKKHYNEADAWPYVIDEFYEYLGDIGKI